MEKILTMALVITLLFCIFKVVEMKFIDKEWKPLKYMIRDSVIVFLSSTIGIFTFSYMNGSIRNFMNVVTDSKSLNLSTTEVFTDEPGF